MLKFFLLILCILQPLIDIKAQTQPYALIRKVSGLEFVPTSIRERMERAGLQAVLKQQGYQVLMSPEDLPESSTVEIVAIESDIVKEESRYRIETRLLDIKNKTLVRKAIIKNVREEELLRLFQASIEAVFKPKNEIEEVNEESKEEKEKKNPPKLPSLNASNNNPHVNNFKERINAMKSGIDLKLKKVVENKKEELDEEVEKEKKNADRSSSSSSSLSATSAAQLPEKEDPSGKFKSQSTYQAMVGFDKRTITSQYLIATKTNTEMLTFKLNAHNTTKFFSQKLAWSYNLGVSKLLSGKIEVPILYQLGLYGTWLDQWGSISLGVMRDKSIISTLESPGQGLTVSNLDTDWFIIKSEVALPFLANSKIHAAYGTPLLVTSQIDQLKNWGGSYSAIGIIPPRLVGNWDLNIILERIKLSNQGVVPFTSEDSRIALLVQRLF